MVSIGKAISLVENRTPPFKKLLKKLFPHTGEASIIGVTGPPGSGKSTLVDCLVSTHSSSESTPGVIAVDPSSPYTGGSVLGDRIRFGERSGNSDVFYRSMSSRGSAGGLAVATNDAIRILDAAGYDPILVETVGAGQNEIDVVRTADTVLVVVMPSSGDEIQMLKAGILEIADVFVVNKMDLSGADRTVMDLKQMIRHRTGNNENTENNSDWEIPVIQTQAEQGKNIQDLRDSIINHQAYLTDSDMDKVHRHERIKDETKRMLRERLNQKVEIILEEEGGIDNLVELIKNNDSDPYSTVDDIIEKIDTN